MPSHATLENNADALGYSSWKRYQDDSQEEKNDGLRATLHKVAMHSHITLDNHTMPRDYSSWKRWQDELLEGTNDGSRVTLHIMGMQHHTLLVPSGNRLTD